jgi:predicted RNase H-like nuclease
MGRASSHVFAGVDGCRAGWVVAVASEGVTQPTVEIVPDFAAVLRHCSAASAIAVDMPIGLSDFVEVGGREADRQARALLRPIRSSSVFPAPAREVVKARSYAEALMLSHEHSNGRRIGLSQQCFHLFGKIREIDDHIGPKDQERIFESHPEVAFCSLNHGNPMPHPKRTKPGQAERRVALASVGIDADLLEAGIPRRAAQADDILDAAVLCWLAGRIFRGEASRVPEVPPFDSRGLRMEIWY